MGWSFRGFFSVVPLNPPTEITGISTFNTEILFHLLEFLLTDIQVMLQSPSTL